jgi:hypothetical protein
MATKHRNIKEIKAEMLERQIAHNVHVVRLQAELEAVKKARGVKPKTYTWDQMYPNAKPFGPSTK